MQSDGSGNDTQPGKAEGNEQPVEATQVGTLQPVKASDQSSHESGESAEIGVSGESGESGDSQVTKRDQIARDQIKDNKGMIRNVCADNKKFTNILTTLQMQ